MSFSPSDVPEIAAGYWWSASLGVRDLGAASFVWAEQNGKTAGDQVQATVSMQPARQMRGSHLSMRYDISTAAGFGGLGTQTATSSTVQVGWTGATYVCGRWFIDDTINRASASNLFTHSTEAVGGRRIAYNIPNSNTAFRLSMSADGSATSTVDFAQLPTGREVFLEFVFNPAAASGSRGELWVNRAQQTKTSGGITVASLFNAPAKISVCCRSTATQNAYKSGVVWCAYANGIPSDARRDTLAGYDAGTKLSGSLALASHAIGSAAASEATGLGTTGSATGSVTEN